MEPPKRLVIFLFCVCLVLSSSPEQCKGQPPRLDPLHGPVRRDSSLSTQSDILTTSLIEIEPSDKSGIQRSRLASASDGDYHIVAVSELDGLNKRQTSSTYVSASGDITNDCTSVPLYRLRNGTLSAVVAGLTYTYSTNPGVSYQVFVPSQTPGSINTTFWFGGDGSISWFNTNFDNGQAQFCATTAGSVYATFASNFPDGCYYTRLYLFQSSSCAALTTRFLPASTSTVVTTLRQTVERVVVTTFETTQPASTQTVVVTTTQGPSTVVSTYATTYPASTFTTVQTQTRTIVTTAPGSTITTTADRSITTTAVTTAYGTGPAPWLCGNQGLQYAAVFNNQPSNNDGSASSYNPTYLKAPSAGGASQQIYYTAVTNTLGGLPNCPNGNGNITVYGNPTSFPCYQFSLNHRGYFYVYATGTWTITISAVDDVAFFWGGAFAQQGWTRANSNLTVVYNDRAGKSYPMSLTQGTYLPIRVVFGQGDGGAGFNLVLTDPNGVAALSTSNTTASPYLVQYSCDSTSAPPYAYAFGQEL